MSSRGDKLGCVPGLHPAKNGYTAVLRFGPMAALVGAFLTWFENVPVFGGCLFFHAYTNTLINAPLQLLTLPYDCQTHPTLFWSSLSPWKLVQVCKGSGWEAKGGTRGVRRNDVVALSVSCFDWTMLGATPPLIFPRFPLPTTTVLEIFIVESRRFFEFYF